jgi:hypothetical protein
MISVALTPAQYTAKSAELLAKEGITLTGTSGTVSKSVVTLKYDYDGAILNIAVEHAPPFLKGHVESELRAWLNS